MTRRSEIGAAVIGSGFIGTVHTEALRRIGVRVTGVLGSSPERGAESAAALDVPRGYSSLDDLLADPSVQAVHVTSPNQLHHRQVLAILAAGRHVICEKPLAMTSAESGELVEAARSSGLVHAVNVAGAQPAGWPKFTNNWMIPIPVVGDVDGDGLLEVVINSREGLLFVWDTKGPVQVGGRPAIQWAKFHHDLRNSGNFNSPLH